MFLTETGLEPTSEIQSMKFYEFDSFTENCIEHYKINNYSQNECMLICKLNNQQSVFNASCSLEAHTLINKQFIFYYHLILFYNRPSYKIRKSMQLIYTPDQLAIINQRQAQKIRFLQNQKKITEQFVKDLQQTLALNKRSLTLLASQKTKQVIETFQEENWKLHSIINRYHEEALAYEAKLLIEEQLKNEEKQFYNERVLEFENKVSELRKFLQDKEDSYTAILLRLKQYEELSELTLSMKLQRFKKEIKQGCLEEIIENLIQQRDRYRQMFRKMNVEMDDLIFLKDCLTNQKSYEILCKSYMKHQKAYNIGVIADKAIGQGEQKRDTNSSKIVNKNKENPNRELIRLLKKQKLNNQILEAALNNAIQNNEELVEQITEMQTVNVQLQDKIQSLQGQIILLSQQLSQNKKTSKSKQNRNNKQDIDRPLLRVSDFSKSQETEPQTHIQTMNYDMSRMAQFIVTYIPQKKLGKSFSSQSLGTIYMNKEDSMIEIQEIY